ncbi:MAG: hypothetical protein FE78DRAFT_91921 [Acidomyces sp. 'richmondensis']|nr:MAG: hypothetical protein FE78DRAFT_91921 [Acidomyces sp. 'richmondensis']
MADQETSPSVQVAGIPLDSTTAPVNPIITKPAATLENDAAGAADPTETEQSSPKQSQPEVAEERCASITSSHSTNGGKQGEAERAGSNALKRTESNFEYPPLKARVVVMIAILLAVFLIALVRMPLRQHSRLFLRVFTFQPVFLRAFVILNHRYVEFS